jgi:glycosyltransferase involved in cell wall biosynthesis
VREPGVSVVIPCYGQAQFLSDAVASVVAQTIPWWEAIIIDDGSPDDTAMVAKRLIAEYGPRVRLIRQENRGVSAARNAGIAASRGRFILPLDADDAIEPEMLAITAIGLGHYPPTTVVYTQYRTFGDRDVLEPLADFDLDLLTVWDFVPYCSLFRREAWEAVGGYNEDMVEGYEDWDFWLALAANGATFHRTTAPLFRYRVHAGSRMTMAQAHDLELRARIRRHHPELFTAESERRGNLRFAQELSRSRSR